MTAPPQIPPIAPSYLNPSTSSSSSFLQSFMAPFNHNPNGQPSQLRRASTSPTNENNVRDLLFITTTNPDGFKSRTNMTKIRKKAMGSFLENEKKQAGPSSMRGGKRARLQSEDSNASRSSAASTISDPEAPDREIMPNDEAIKIYRKDKRSPRQRFSDRNSNISSSNNSNNGDSPVSTGSQANQKVAIVSLRSNSKPQPWIEIVMVQPSRKGPLIYDETAPRPFESLAEPLGTPLDPFDTMFNPPSPYISIQHLKWHCSQAFGSKAMGQHWIPTLVDSPHAFLSTISIASAHKDALDMIQGDSMQTVALRLELMHLIEQQLIQGKIDDHNIIAVTQLIASEIISGDESVVQSHEKGLTTMVELRGGLENLGLTGRVASTLSWVCLESAVLREAQPDRQYWDFRLANTIHTYPTSAIIPESPLFRPRSDFYTIKRSRRSSQRTMKLLKDMRSMLDRFALRKEQNSQDSVLRSLHKAITTDYPPARDPQAQNNVLTYSDWTYEAIRLTCIIQAEAIINRIPHSAALASAGKIATKPRLTVPTKTSGSSESLVSPRMTRHDSPVTTFSATSSYATSPAFSQHSNSFTSASFPAQSRPSIASTTSTSSTSSNLNFPWYSISRPAPPPPPTTTLLENIKLAIESSNVSECWSDMAGVLLWIGLVVGAASRSSEDRPLKKWFQALAVRCSIFLCFEFPEPVHASLVRMAEIEEALGFLEQRIGNVAPMRVAPGKRKM
ncbi:hypothetical protein BU24DRAFT_110733 [Aaosphaeria arxii CBS 175.79]|uniref:Uncharacterized protein n=1 Tax=Aaosphaeria arxii CBS 175.79 TaxID=1450172 RepID=A0A6A5Y1F0_9PLEO|nr:uncharacterized protein BU24DRAFT_110733 [Aaosphaeria arxii CBS 175.79]KAF2019023.1 hypothetical protein BU24DRAFT_110733 [Aaosphaeria arxii CBS 175.79]